LIGQTVAGYPTGYPVSGLTGYPDGYPAGLIWYPAGYRISKKAGLSGWISGRPVYPVHPYNFEYCNFPRLEDDLTWSALDFSVEPPANRTFRAEFPSQEAANEFRDVFAEGKVSWL
jgi:hypothetical protein